MTSSAPLHPSMAYAFDELVEQLQERMTRRLVKATRAPDDDQLVLYCYTKTAMFDRQLARGLVLDHRERRVIARPFPKFFNYGERTAALPDESFSVLEKLDGSLGIVFHDGRRWRVATKGSFTAEQTTWGERWLDSRDLSCLIPGTTYLFEIIYETNRVVVRYAFENLVLLGAFAGDGAELDRDQLQAIARNLDTRACHATEFATLDAVLEAAAGYSSDQEGFVVRFSSGFRIKIKGAEYLRIHRLISRVTPIALWEVMAAGDSLDVIRRDIPEEFWGDFDTIRALLEAKLAELIDVVAEVKAAWSDKDDKALGLALKTIPAPANGLIFAARKEGERWFDSPRVRTNLFRTIRPTGNVLEGYVPSESLGRVHDEAG